MNLRTQSRIVTFAHPFQLTGIDDWQPPGDYRIDTDEEQINGLTFLAWRRVATTIAIVRDGSTEIYRIDPADLERCLVCDADLEKSTRVSADQMIGPTKTANVSGVVHDVGPDAK